MAGEGSPPPIDRPLSNTYVRDFLGWSTVHAPGLSEDSSLRQMENVLIGRDGSARIRPALRLMFEDWLPSGVTLVGSFEQYFDHEGDKCILFATRNGSNIVTFWTAWYDGKHYCDPQIVPDTVVSGGSNAPPPVLDSRTTYVKYLQINNRIYCLSNSSYDSIKVFDTNTGTFEIINGFGTNRPTWVAGTRFTYTNLTHATDDYNYAFFFTRINAFGESKPSTLEHTNLDIKWTGWPSNASLDIHGLPDTGDFNLYMVEWSRQSPVPVEGILIHEQRGDLTGGTLSVTSSMMLGSSNEGNHMLPSPADIDFSTPPISSNGLVAADRLILVNDWQNRARIRWSSNEPGYYGSFSPGRGGGFKTLSSGNLQIPYSVVLWQNPQSVDTLTVLCNGIDGYHTAYYMTPASVSGQTEELLIMGFEETTATPGTAAIYGNEVFNNALYHPLEDQLMKSSTNNYNIFHKSVSEQIADRWLNLRNKRNIISSQFDGRLYFIVDNPDGAPVEDGCFGNEIWIADAGIGEGVRWSRFLISAMSLRKIEHNDRLYMAVVRPDGIYRLDELEYMDQWPDGDKAIPWFFQTNTNAASAQADRWVQMHQVGVTFGNIYGTVRYGVQSWTVDGKPLDIHKVYRQPLPINFKERPLPFDHDDWLLVRQYTQQWFFSASSVVDPKTGDTLPSYGQISSIVYRMAKASANVGYELGSIETYEYAHADDGWTQRTAINGIPIPIQDPRRP